MGGAGRPCTDVGDPGLVVAVALEHLAGRDEQALAGPLAPRGQAFGRAAACGGRGRHRWPPVGRHGPSHGRALQRSAPRRRRLVGRRCGPCPPCRPRSRACHRGCAAWRRGPRPRTGCRAPSTRSWRGCPSRRRRRSPPPAVTNSGVQDGSVTGATSTSPGSRSVASAGWSTTRATPVARAGRARAAVQHVARRDRRDLDGRRAGSTCSSGGATPLTTHGGLQLVELGVLGHPRVDPARRRRPGRRGSRRARRRAACTRRGRGRAARDPPCGARAPARRGGSRGWP